MLNNIVDNLEQCGQQNIVQCSFHQARTGCSFFAVYCFNVLHVYVSDMSTLVISMLLELFGLGRHLCVCCHLLSNGNRLPSM